MPGSCPGDTGSNPAPATSMPNPLYGVSYAVDSGEEVRHEAHGECDRDTKWNYKGLSAVIFAKETLIGFVTAQGLADP